MTRAVDDRDPERLQFHATATPTVSRRIRSVQGDIKVAHTECRPSPLFVGRKEGGTSDDVT